jgi:hypothetical protein
VSQLGIVTCVICLPDVREFVGYLIGAGFEVHTISCFIGGIKDKEIGIPQEYSRSDKRNLDISQRLDI